jgi:hypothetical protein
LAGKQIMTKANKYLLISGAPKSGTTSLFRYLSDHPEICPSHRKETYFFAREFDLKKVCQSNETLEEFETYFSHCHSNPTLRLEATPYTLYAKDAARKIATLLPNALVLFVLRDPIQRLISDYRFHIQRGHPSTAGSIQDFLKWQTGMTGKIPNLIDQGCYIRFIQEFIDVLGESKILIIFLEDLILNRLEELQKLCILLRINGSFYSTYNFGIHNPTINYRSSKLNRLYIRLEPVVANIRSSLMHKPKLYELFEQTINFGKSGYRLINSQKSSTKESFPREVLQDLAVYYQPYNKLLSEEFGRTLPWKMIEHQ